MDDRLTPFDLVFGELAAERFPALRAGIAAANRDPRDRDAFVLVREVVELLRDLAPGGGGGEGEGGEGIRELVSFVHACYLYWVDGACGALVGREKLDRALRERDWSLTGGDLTGSCYYLQLAPHRVWGTPVEGAPPEPLDGCFVIPRGDSAGLVAVFGLHPTRDGLTVVEAAGPRPRQLSREDGSPPFSPKLEGGDAAGLFQVVGESELLELVYRCHGLLGPAGATPGSRQVSVA